MAHEYSSSEKCSQPIGATLSGATLWSGLQLWTDSLNLQILQQDEVHSVALRTPDFYGMRLKLHISLFFAWLVSYTSSLFFPQGSSKFFLRLTFNELFSQEFLC
jgi:hypothetical protein